MARVITLRLETRTTAQQGRRGMKAITGATLIDGRGGPPLPDATVLVEGGSIVAAGASAQVDVPGDAPVIEAHGLTLLPGLNRLPRPPRQLRLRDREPLGADRDASAAEHARGVRSASDAGEWLHHRARRGRARRRVPGRGGRGPRAGAEAPGGAEHHFAHPAVSATTSAPPATVTPRSPIRRYLPASRTAPTRCERR